ncbi:MAG: hypothetical protein JEZ14_01585 [Marinilabiliaceae bacterium]|nr:hypothetical protein [Marinilabiliaceae bacterium]
MGLKEYFVFSFLLVLLVGCIPKQRNDVQKIVFDDSYYNPVSPNDIKTLTDLTIDVVAKVFPDANISIQPLFNEHIEEESILRDLAFVHSEDGDHIQFDNNQLHQFVLDINCLKGKEVINFLPLNKQEYVSNELSDVNIVLSPPMVDRKELIVCFFVHLVYKYKDGYASDDIYYFFELTPDKQAWYLSLSKEPESKNINQ